MPGVREFLLRLRPAGAPGSAAAAGVPVDPKARAGDELEPIFEALRPISAQCRRLREEADRQAAATVLAAKEQARALLSRAHDAAAAERAGVAADLVAQVEVEVTRLAAGAEAEAARVRHSAAARRDSQIAQVLAEVRRQLSGLDGEAR